MDYSFVQSIGVEPLSEQRLEELRTQAVGDSHTDVILKEALLDRPRDTTALAARVANVTAAGHFILTSFPDGRFTGGNLLVRSEFLLLREVGSGCFSFEHSRRYVAHTLARILPYRPGAVIYRCLDYNPEDFAFLPAAMHSAGNGCRIVSRGAQRLLDQPALLDLDCQVMKAIADRGIRVDVLIPFVQFPEQTIEILARLRRALRGYQHRIARFGLMLEVPANLFQISSFADVDFFVFGPGDLLKHLYGGVSRDDRSYAQVSTSVLVEPLQTALHVIERYGGKDVFLAKRLIDVADQLHPSRYARTRFRWLLMPNQIADMPWHDDFVAEAMCHERNAALQLS
jgi:hypothetical protein